jgi:hypothetical protein
MIPIFRPPPTGTSAPGLIRGVLHFPLRKIAMAIPWNKVAHPDQVLQRFASRRSVVYGTKGTPGFQFNCSNLVIIADSIPRDRRLLPKPSSPSRPRDPPPRRKRSRRCRSSLRCTERHRTVMLRDRGRRVLLVL